MSGERELLRIESTGFGWFSLFMQGEELATSRCIDTIALLASTMLRKEKDKIKKIIKSQPPLEKRK
jgi:hypothetical protein